MGRWFFTLIELISFEYLKTTVVKEQLEILDIGMQMSSAHSCRVF